MLALYSCKVRTGLRPVLDNLVTLRLLTTIRSLLTFYKKFIVPSFPITLFCCLLFFEYGTPILLVLHWLKLSATAIIFFYTRTSRAKEFYYYLNLGLTPSFLWFSTLTFDLLLYLGLLITTHSITMHQLSANSILLTFGHRPILSDINLRLRTGTISGLLGRNGTGKSCLLQILYGTLPATAHSITFDGQPVSRPYHDPRLIRFLPQFNFIPKSLSLRRVLDDFQLEFSDLEKRFPEFSQTWRKLIGQLSGGHRRFIELYIIIRSASRFALLDEPFTHLMPLQVEKVKELLLEYRSKKAFLLTDHLFRDVTAVSDQLYILSEGTTYLLENPTHLLDNPAHLPYIDTYLPPRRN
jgi:lipopolysaccharide export system ATP-binding protein